MKIRIDLLAKLMILFRLVCFLLNPVVWYILAWVIIDRIREHRELND